MKTHILISALLLLGFQAVQAQQEVISLEPKKIVLVNEDLEFSFTSDQDDDEACMEELFFICFLGTPNIPSAKPVNIVHHRIALGTSFFRDNYRNYQHEEINPNKTITDVPDYEITSSGSIFRQGEISAYNMGRR